MSTPIDLRIVPARFDMHTDMHTLWQNSIDCYPTNTQPVGFALSHTLRRDGSYWMLEPGHTQAWLTYKNGIGRIPVTSKNLYRTAIQNTSLLPVLSKLSLFAQVLADRTCPIHQQGIQAANRFSASLEQTHRENRIENFLHMFVLPGGILLGGYSMEDTTENPFFPRNAPPLRDHFLTLYNEEMTSHQRIAHVKNASHFLSAWFKGSPEATSQTPGSQIFETWRPRDPYDLQDPAHVVPIHLPQP